MQMTQLPRYTSRTTAIRRLQKKRMQVLLARPEFQVLVESAPDALVMIDEQGRIALVNHQTEVLFGYSRRELLGQELEYLLPAQVPLSAGPSDTTHGCRSGSVWAPQRWQ
jgi:PAS domain-containing protein